MTTDEMPCVVSQMFDFCRDEGLGNAGTTLFGYDLPDEEGVKYPNSVCLMEIHTGNREELLSGVTSMHREILSLVSRHSSAEKAKNALVPFVTKFKEVSGFLTTQGVKYSSIIPKTPIHLGGKDKNGRWVAEIDFAILRKPV